MKNIKVLNAFTLKIIALLAMTIDHIGYSIFDNNLACNLIGRIAFPIFSFLIVESFFYTRSRSRMLLRVFICAVISEIPFDLGLFHSLFYWQHQNTMFTLFLGLLMIYISERLKNRFATLIIALLTAALATFLKVDYNYLGILIIFIFYYFRGNFQAIFMGEVLANFALRFGKIQMYAGLAMIPIFFYNGRPGTKKFKWLFYIFYPAHLIIIYAVFCFVKFHEIL